MERLNNQLISDSEINNHEKQNYSKMAGTIAAVVYSLTLKTLEGLKAATFVLFIIHLFWTLPDFVTLLSGGSQHPPIILGL
jgi:hypothetical protein